MPTYTATGPFANGGAPGIQSSFLNNIETFLAGYSDSHISVDGNGKLTVVNVALAVGGISRIKTFGPVACINGKTTVAHGLGVTPDWIGITILAAASGSTASAGYDSSTVTSTNVDIWGNGLFNVFCIAVKF